MKIISFAFKALIFFGLYVLATQHSEQIAPFVSRAVSFARSHAAAYLKPDLNAAGVTTFGGWWDCRQHFGNPTKMQGDRASPDPSWQSENLTSVSLPWKGHAAWNRDLAITTLQVHRDVAPSLGRALTKIWLDVGQSQVEIDRLGLSAIGGGYVWRQVRDGVGLSTHAYGCAIDFDPARNALGDRAANLAKPENDFVVQDLKAEGWVWGGDWPHPDAMHFQATSRATAVPDAVTAFADKTHSVLEPGELKRAENWIRGWLAKAFKL